MEDEGESWNCPLDVPVTCMVHLGMVLSGAKVGLRVAEFNFIFMYSQFEKRLYVHGTWQRKALYVICLPSSKLNRKP